MKKFTTLALAVALAAPSLFAAEQVYVVTADSYFYGPWEASDDDVVLTLNDETGFFENPDETFMFSKGVMPGQKPAHPTSFMFYTKDEEGNTSFFGGEMLSAVALFNANPYETTRVIGDSPWYINSFVEKDMTEGEVTIKMSLTEQDITVIVEQVNVVVAVPEVLYLWGTEDGGNTEMTNMATLLPSEDNPMVFTTTFDVPYCPGPFTYDDPEMKPSEEDDNLSGFRFFLTPEKDNIRSSKVIRYGGTVHFRTIDMGDDETTATIQMVRNIGGNIIDETPGLTHFSFDLESLVLTATLDTESSAVETIGAVEAGETVYFDLQGRRVANPEKGIFIRKSSDNVEKVVL